MKVSKVVKPTKKNRYYKTLETSVINNPMSPSSLRIITLIKISGSAPNIQRNSFLKGGNGIEQSLKTIL